MLREKMKRSYNTWPLLVLLTTFLISACSLPAYKETHEEGYIERGLASWYGHDFHGRPTSSREIYDMNALTAAHKLLPLGSVARVTNMQNGNSVTVKINDRGPFVEGRIIDMSYGAAMAIDMVDAGVVPVEIAILKWGRFTDYTVQVGSFVVEENALRLKRQLEKKYENVYIVPYLTNDLKFFRVRVGATKDVQSAESLMVELANDGLVTYITRKD